MDCIGMKIFVLIIMLMVFINYFFLSCKRDVVCYGREVRVVNCFMVIRILVWDVLFFYL